ncbi:MAG: hypothetical protein J6Q68_03110 [Clostridia bacterium]|nr:hypothetical protein [Clostridia bacterium]
MKKLRINVKKLISALLLVFVFASALSVFAFADGDDDLYLRQWALSEDLETLYSGIGSLKSGAYKRITLPYGFYTDFRSVHCFENTVELPNEEREAYVYGAGIGKDIYRVFTSQETLIYASDDEILAITDFIEGRYGKIRIRMEEMSYESVAEEKLFSFVLSENERQNYDVTTLSSLEKYCVTAHDASDSFATEIGMIFVFADGSVHYLNYSHLDNSNFTAEGTLSYRSGSVPLQRLRGEALSAYEITKENLSYRQYYTTYEVEPSYEVGSILDGIGGTVGMICFWVGVAILGFAVPAAVVVLGFLIPRSKKHKGERRWYAFAVAGGVWILFAGIFILTLLI